MEILQCLSSLYQVYERQWAGLLEMLRLDFFKNQQKKKKQRVCKIKVNCLN